MYDEIEEINEMADQLRKKTGNLIENFNAKLWDFLKGQISVYDEFSNNDMNAEITDVNDDGICFQVSTKDIINDFLNNGLECVVVDEFGNCLDFERDIDGSTVTLKVDTTLTIQDAVEQRLKGSECEVTCRLLKDLDAKSFDEVKDKLDRYKAMCDILDKHPLK